MKKIAIKIIALVPSEFQPGYYTLLLEEIGGKRQLPIIIGAFEAQAIAQNVHKDTSKKQFNAFDLFPAFLKEASVNINEFLIADVEEGIFQNYFFGLNANGTDFKLKVRTGEGIAIAIRLNCPIYISAKVMEEVGVLVEESGNVLPLKNRTLEEHTLQELQDLLESLVAKEDYREASRVRDLIQKKKDVKRA